MKNFEDLESWKLGRQLRNEIAVKNIKRLYFLFKKAKGSIFKHG